ncbi:putative quinol monooxygenase [Actinacidiphila paucisporea]|uniref:Quinol monooxygenase YgiN n=1 Tax=Actinacidiphila paucisporea TaxID=310782 RepID=A0A1M6YME3_9ACTN|nr:putative quinol monooxygenase [Actinacidiphila paucisporea]SHL19491.1 Quinol monooxygenase YgiN [Actinacidiphila paucisporea]
MTHYQVIAHHHIDPDQDLDEVLALYPPLAEASRQEPGNVSFRVYRQLDDERAVVVLERYTSRAAFAEHQRTPHFEDILLAQIVPRLRERTREAYDVPPAE